MRRRRSRGRRRRWWLSNNRRRNAFKDRHQMLAGAFSQHGIKSFLLFLFAFFIIFNIFFNNENADVVFIRHIFLERPIPLPGSADSSSNAYIRHWNSLGAYRKEIWAVCQGQAYECDSPKNDCVSEGNIKMNSSALRWLHRALSIGSVRWGGVFHFIHHLQLAAMILQDQVHTISTHKEKHPEFSLLEKPSVWEVQVCKRPALSKPRLLCPPGWKAAGDNKQGPSIWGSSMRPFYIHCPSEACACSHTYFAKLFKLNETKTGQKASDNLTRGECFCQWERVLASKTYCQGTWYGLLNTSSEWLSSASATEPWSLICPKGCHFQRTTWQVYTKHRKILSTTVQATGWWKVSRDCSSMNSLPLG